MQVESLDFIKSEERKAGFFFFVNEGATDLAMAANVLLHPLTHWVIDSGSSWHMTPRADLLHEIQHAPISTVTSATGAKAKVMGMGCAKFMGADGELVGLKNVLWVPNLCANLISTGQLGDAGVNTETIGSERYRAYNDKWLIWDLQWKGDVRKQMWQIPVLPWRKSGKAAAAASMEESVTEEEQQGVQGEELIGGSAAVKAPATSGQVDWETWHWQLAHVAVSTLEVMHKETCVHGLQLQRDGAHYGSCEVCMQNKFARFPFSRAEGSAKAPLEVVHMDLVGPMRTEGTGGVLYFLTMVDEWSRFTWARPLSKKSNAAAAINEDWLPMVERQAMRLVKVLRIDRGGEFLGVEFTKFLKNNGIRHQLTCPGTPQQNGIVERANRTIGKAAKTLLGAAGMPYKFWPEAVRQVITVKNRVLTHVGDKHWVPYERAEAQAGSCCCVGCPSGMAPDSKGWLMWDPKSKRTLVSRDVKFVEDVMYKDWQQQQQVQIGLRLDHSGGGEQQVSGLAAEEGLEDESARVDSPSQPEPAATAKVTKRSVQRGASPHGQQIATREKRVAAAPSRLKCSHLGGPKQGAMAVQADEGEDEEMAFCFFTPLPGEPAIVEEALSGPQKEEWKAAMDAEFNCLIENETWELVELPEGRRPISSKWVFKTPSLVSNKIFAPVIKPVTLRTVLAGAALKGWHVKQMDITTAFLNGILLEDIYMAQPDGYEDGTSRIERTQKLLMDNFKCKMLGDVHYYLGLQIERDLERRWLKVYQSHYISGVMERYGVTGGCTVMTPFLAGFKLKKAAEEDDVLEDEQRNEYQSLIGSVMYAAVHTRPDASFGVGQLARVVQRPTQEQLEVAKRLVRYLGSTASAGGPVSWRSKKQSEIAQSSGEAEYMAMYQAIKEIVLLRKLLEDMGAEQEGPTPLFSDSEAAIGMANNPILNGLNKHMKIKWHWVRQMVKEGIVELHHVKASKQGTYFLTKRLPESAHWKCAKIRGGEFLSKEFSLWLKKNGIRHSLTMPYSPAMNGIAERANRTITETERGLLIEARLPDYFWPDAVRGMCVAKNRALTHVGAEKWVPYLEWIGRKPKVDMLRVFGCMCMALVTKHLQHNKLSAKAIWAVHLGMAQNSKGWFLCDPFTRKFLVSRDCKFMENLMYKDWKAENEAKIGMRFGEVKSSSLEHVELPLDLSSGSTTTRQSSLVNGGEEANDAEEEEEEVQQVSEHALTLPYCTMSAPRIQVTPQQRQGLHVPAAEEEGRGKRRIQAPNRLTYDAPGKPDKTALAGAALMVGDDEESDYEECAFAFFSPVVMPGEPATLKEALESSDAEEWKKAMESELKSIEENGTWELVELPEGRKAITSKWLFKIKSDADGKIERYSLGLWQRGWVVKQMDLTTAFLNSILEKEIFMAQPQGFDDGSGRVWKLKKALYGLKQAPRQWYLKLREVLEEIGFTPSSADHSLFMLGEGEQRSFMVVYVDDILIFSPSSDLVKEVMLKLQDKFKCKALGNVSFYLGLHIERDVEKRCMRVHQQKYLEALTANFGQIEGHVATPFPSGFKCVKGPEEESVGEEERRRFHSLVGSLMYAAVNTQPDVAVATRQLARHPVPVVFGGAGGAVAEGEGTGAAGASGVGSGGAGGVGVEFPPCSSLRPVAAEPVGVPAGGTGGPGGVGGGGAVLGGA
ncbi:unnamed protein product [Closterium sp. NIES-53]